MNIFQKLVPALFLLMVPTIVFQQHQERKKKQAKQRYLESETTIGLMNQGAWKRKLVQEPPDWMKNQIAEDFQEFSKKKISNIQVDKTFLTIRKNYPHPWIVRYRIINQELYRYFPPGEPISLVDNDVEKALKTLMHIRSFKDLDFILSYIDGIPIDGMPSESFYQTDSKELQAPLFFSAKRKGTPYIILIPDWRSVSHWWATDIQSILTEMKDSHWETKKDVALWRGSLTKPIRRKLCQISSLYPESLDAKFNVKVGDLGLQEQLEKEGLFGHRVSWKEFLVCKYLPIVDGVCCASPAFQWRLLSNSVTLKQESNEIQWFYGELQPYIHYIPIKNDLSDLIEKVEWARSNDSLCQKIAACSTEFALSHLMLEDVYLYFFLVLKHYESLMSMDDNAIKYELTNDSRWVNIQYRKKLKHRLKKEQSQDYITTASPF